jgi:hypothetical protein
MTAGSFLKLDRVWLAGLSSCCLFLLFGTPALSTAAAFSVRMGYPQPSGAMLPIWVMSDARSIRDTASTSRISISPAEPGSRRPWLPGMSIWPAQAAR